MSYVKTHGDLVEQFPYTVGNLRRDNPRTSFPKRLSETMLAQYGVFPVTYADPPDYNHMTHRIEHATQPSLAADGWVVPWSIVPLTFSEIEERTRDTERMVRASRNSLLSETDWTQVADAPVDATAWATYRQALRDITDHVNFPYLTEADWPVVGVEAV